MKVSVPCVLLSSHNFQVARKFNPVPKPVSAMTKCVLSCHTSGALIPRRKTKRVSLPPPAGGAGGGGGRRTPPPYCLTKIPPPLPLVLPLKPLLKMPIKYYVLPYGYIDIDTKYMI